MQNSKQNKADGEKERAFGLQGSNIQIIYCSSDAARCWKFVEA